MEDETDEMTEEELVAEEEVSKHPHFSLFRPFVFLLFLPFFLIFGIIHPFLSDGDSYSGCGGGQEGEHGVPGLQRGVRHILQTGC